jgi:hypothetical protein
MHEHGCGHGLGTIDSIWTFCIHQYHVLYGLEVLQQRAAFIRGYHTLAMSQPCMA